MPATRTFVIALATSHLQDMYIGDRFGITGNIIHRKVVIYFCKRNEENYNVEYLTISLSIFTTSNPQLSLTQGTYCSRRFWLNLVETNSLISRSLA
jgi:hypothetical protein